MSSNIYVVQSGKISLFVERSGHKVEVGTLGPYQILGEQSVITNARNPFCAEAVQGTRLAEMPTDQIKALYEKLPANLKLFVRALIEETKQARHAIRSLRLETDKSPCPQMAVPRIFTLVHLIPRHIGKADVNDPQAVTLSWLTFKNYANRFFGESPVRLRSLMDLLKKLHLATFHLKMVGKEGEEEEELTDLTIFKLQELENFAEFYQYHFFKGGRSEAIYVDPNAMKAARTIVECSDGAEVDFKGGTQVEFALVQQKFKEKYRAEFNTTTLGILENKGLFTQRKSKDNGPVYLVFDRAEFAKMSFYWSIIHEIDKWNKTGSVDLNEKEEAQAAKSGCPECHAPTDDKQKFCSNCGFKLAA